MKMEIPMGNGRKIYVAGRYRGETESIKTENIWHAVRVSVRLWELGWYVFCPHANAANFDNFSALPPEVYLKGGIEFLKCCEAIFMLKGWESSKGAKREFEVAKIENIEIIYESI